MERIKINNNTYVFGSNYGLDKSVSVTKLTATNMYLRQSPAPWPKVQPSEVYQDTRVIYAWTGSSTYNLFIIYSKATLNVGSQGNIFTTNFWDQLMDKAVSGEETQAHYISAIYRPNGTVGFVPVSRIMILKNSDKIRIYYNTAKTTTLTYSDITYDRGSSPATGKIGSTTVKFGEDRNKYYYIPKI